MNDKQRKTLELIFTDPIPANIINWQDIETLFILASATVVEGKESRLRVSLNDRFAIFHRPYYQKKIDKMTVVSVRKFLSNSGIKN